MVGANFISVGDEALDIQDLKVTGDDGSEGGTYIKWWNPSTKTYETEAHWVRELYDPTSGESTGVSGWGDEIYWYPITKTFAPGEGFWFSPYLDNVGITVSGQVVQDKTTEYLGRTVTTANQQIMVLNPFPTVLDLQDIVVEGDDGSEGGTYVKWWNPSTKTYETEAHWVRELYDPTSGESTGVSGWGDEIYWYPITKEFAVGDGFWFSPYLDNVTICMPNPFYEAK